MRGAPLAFRQTIAKAHRYAGHGSVAMPGVCLWHIVEHQSGARFNIKISGVRQCHLPAQCYVCAIATVRDTLVARVSKVKTRNAIHLKRFGAILVSSLS